MYIYLEIDPECVKEALLIVQTNDSNKVTSVKEVTDVGKFNLLVELKLKQGASIRRWLQPLRSARWFKDYKVTKDII